MFLAKMNFDTQVILGKKNLLIKRVFDNYKVCPKINLKSILANNTSLVGLTLKTHLRVNPRVPTMRSF